MSELLLSELGDDDNVNNGERDESDGNDHPRPPPQPLAGDVLLFQQLR